MGCIGVNGSISLRVLRNLYHRVDLIVRSVDWFQVILGTPRLVERFDLLLKPFQGLDGSKEGAGLPPYPETLGLPLERWVRFPETPKTLQFGIVQ
jgi:hypothetical protein